jgi:hypothetical protein
MRRPVWSPRSEISDPHPIGAVGDCHLRVPVAKIALEQSGFILPAHTITGKLAGGSAAGFDRLERHGRESRLRIAQLTALLHEFELHLRKNELERARDRLATITTTLALALMDAQRRVVNTG